MVTVRLETILMLHQDQQILVEAAAVKAQPEAEHLVLVDQV